MTALDDIKSYLSTTLSGNYADSVLLQVFTVEATDQANRIHADYQMHDIFDDWALHPSPLREAVLRRVARNLAQRKVPLGIQEGELGNLRVLGRDSEINRLEAPYRKWAVG